MLKWVMMVALLAAPWVARATVIQVTWESSIEQAVWTDPAFDGARTVKGSMLLSTHPASSEYEFATRSDGARVLGSFGFRGLTALSWSATAEGRELFSGVPLSSSYVGEAPGLFLYESFLGGAFDDGDYMFELPLLAVLLEEQLAGLQDPIVGLLAGLPGRGSGTLIAQGQFGFLAGSLVSLSVSEVPEPATLGLLILGILGLAGARSVGARRTR